MRGPRIASRAGRKVSAKRAASATTMAPPMPMANRYERSKKVRPHRPVTTARLEEATTQPTRSSAQASASG